jgi:hypothetical protein
MLFMPNTSLNQIVLISTLALLCGACASTSGGDSAKTASSAPAKNEAAAKSKDSQKDSKEKNGIIGTPAADSKFAKLKIGMQMQEIQNIMGHSPDRTHTHESGKRWIPFYFGNDVRRLQALYKGEGCLTFADGNEWGGAGGELIKITVDPAGACYEP